MAERIDDQAGSIRLSKSVVVFYRTIIVITATTVTLLAGTAQGNWVYCIAIPWVMALGLMFNRYSKIGFQLYPRQCVEYTSLWRRLRIPLRDLDLVIFGSRMRRLVIMRMKSGREFGKYNSSFFAGKSLRDRFRSCANRWKAELDDEGVNVLIDPVLPLQIQPRQTLSETSERWSFLPLTRGEIAFVLTYPFIFALFFMLGYNTT